ncbi:nucleoside hydrolase [Thermobifida halotolerans]|uniref:Nucleoside hydrolase n=1 Tax=Thermobifida halotolerans TaxID=483545 RepID=A0AA97M0F8_9ACTN|nr:nucleoside hydrolase [Thermobifida halotolerans]UOE21339.1 nucleoside hydrolase [Thermobifida halotolerans]
MEAPREETAAAPQHHRRRPTEPAKTPPDNAPRPNTPRGNAMIIDTDIGGDPDDAIALTAAARCVPELALVITSDEVADAHGHGRRARFARWLLDALGRTDVPVVAGADLGNTRYYCVEGLTPDTVPHQDTDVVAAVRALAAVRPGPIRWVGMGPMTNLARLLEQAPELAPRLRITQMGGALRYRDPDRAEHNFRLDVAAVHAVFTAVAAGHLRLPEFVTSEITFVADTEVDADHPLYRGLTEPGAPTWAGLLAAHLDRWFVRFHPATKQHDALALSAALGLPFVDSEPMPLAVDRIGRTTAAGHGTRVRVSTSAHYPGFMSWLRDRLDPAVAPTGPSLPPVKS